MKLAVICEGKAQLENEAPLEFIGDSVDKVSNTLEINGWKCIPYRNAKSTEDFKRLLHDYKDIKVDDFLFYYIGHGYGNNIDTFQIYFEEHSLTIEQIIKDSIKGGLGCYPKNIALVLDACYSGRAIDNTSSVKDIEILTARGRDEQAFEKIMPDGNAWSEFSYYFCQFTSIESPKNTINLKQISQYISALEQTNEETFYLPNPSSLTYKTIIGYNKTIQDIRNLLKTKYPNINDLKKSILRYISRGITLYETILDKNNMDELINLLIQKESSGYLYCLLKSEGMALEYVDAFTGDSCCQEYSHQIKKIMVIVNYDKIDDIYDIGFYIYFDDSEAGHIKWIREKSWDRFLVDVLIEKLEYFTEIVTAQDVELVFVVPYDKVDNKFHALEMKAGFEEEDMESLTEMFRISYKLFPRLEGYHLDNQWIRHWKENLEAYGEAKEQAYINKLCLLNSSESIACFMTYNGGKNSFLLASRCLVDSSELKMIYKKGVPFMTTTSTNYGDFNGALEAYWQEKETKVKNFKEHTYAYLKAKNNVYFLYDDGYDYEFLRSYSQKDIKQKEQEKNNFLGMDNE